MGEFEELHKALKKPHKQIVAENFVSSKRILLFAHFNWETEFSGLLV